MIYLVSTLFNQKFVITYFKLNQNVVIHHNVTFQCRDVTILVKGESLRGTQRLSPLKYVGNTFYAVQSFLFCTLEKHSKRHYKIVIV